MVEIIIRSSGLTARIFFRKTLNISRKHISTQCLQEFFHGLFLNRKKDNTTSTGLKKSSIIFIKRESIPSLQPRQAQDPNGWQTNTKKSCVWIRTEQEDSLVADITTASPLRYTEKRFMRSIRSQPKDSANIRQLCCGIFPMNLAVNATARCVRRSSESG